MGNRAGCEPVLLALPVLVLLALLLVLLLRANDAALRCRARSCCSRTSSGVRRRFSDPVCDDWED